MITGRVNAEYEPIITVELRGGHDESLAVEAIVDTGFNGWITLRPELISRLRLQWSRVGRATLADGHEVIFDRYEGALNWNGRPLRVSVDEADSEPLVGMRLMDGYELRVQAVVGGSVALERMS